MRSGTICVSSSHTTCSWLETILDRTHYLAYVWYLYFWQPNYIDLLFVVLSTVNKLSVVQKIEKLATINFIEWYVKTEVWVALKKIADVESCQMVQTWIAFLISHHSESFTWSSLAIGKASSFSSLECTFYQWLYTQLIDHIVVSTFIKHIVKVKIVLLDVLS